jgi:beta-xylosidase
MTTPIIAGFYPDPSICRVGDDFYLANSSFEYTPGVPISHSTDLVSWTAVGNALDRPDQLPDGPGIGSTGILAPTLRHHDGRFWLVTTNVGQIERGHLIVSAEDPAGPWTDPIYVTGTLGLDPDLCWDDDGVCRLTWASMHPGLHGIASVRIDPWTGRMLGEPQLLWSGTGLAAPEGPHLYRREGWWYLMLAEGGTERGHAVTIARSRSLEDEFEPAPHNPVLTHRSTTHSVQNTGHADLVECADGSWAMVHLGVRPRGRTPLYHVIGRETFLVGIDWVEGWPVVDETRFAVRDEDHTFTDDFSDEHLDARWLSPGIHPAAFTRWDGPGRLALVNVPSPRSTAALVTRVRDLRWSAKATIDVTAGVARVVVRIDDDHWYGFAVDRDRITAVVAIGPAMTELGRMPTPERGIVTLRISAVDPLGPGAYGFPDGPDAIEVAVTDADGTTVRLATVDGRYLSTEVVGGFTGRVVGVEVVDGIVTLCSFGYTTTPTV